MSIEEHRGRMLPVHLIKALFRLKRENKTVSEVARIVGVHRETVYRYWDMTPEEQAAAIRGLSVDPRNDPPPVE